MLGGRPHRLRLLREVRKLTGERDREKDTGQVTHGTDAISETELMLASPPLVVCKSESVRRTFQEKLQTTQERSDRETKTLTRTVDSRSNRRSHLLKSGHQAETIRVSSNGIVVVEEMNQVEDDGECARESLSLAKPSFVQGIPHTSISRAYPSTQEGERSLTNSSDSEWCKVPHDRALWVQGNEQPKAYLRRIGRDTEHSGDCFRTKTDGIVPMLSNSRIGVPTSGVTSKLKRTLHLLGIKASTIRASFNGRNPFVRVRTIRQSIQILPKEATGESLMAFLFAVVATHSSKLLHGFSTMHIMSSYVKFRTFIASCLGRMCCGTVGLS